MAANPACKVEAKVCAWIDKIVGVKTPNMVASGFQISTDLIVTTVMLLKTIFEFWSAMPRAKFNPLYPYRMIFQQTWSFFA